MFAPNIVTVTNINTIEGGTTMFPAIIITTVVIVLAAIVAAFTALALTNYDVARAVIDAIPFDPDAVNAAIARIPGTIKRLAKTTKTATKEAWHTTVTITHDIAWAIRAIVWLCGIVFDGICEDVANFIGSGNAIIDKLPKTVVDIDGVIYNFPFADHNDSDQDKKQRLNRIWIAATFPIWRVYVTIKDTIKLTIDFVYAAYNYIKAHAPSITTDIQVNTWNTITGTINAIVRAVKAIIGAIKAIAHVVWEILGIFAAIGKLIAWISGGIGIDANNALAKVANKF